MRFEGWKIGGMALLRSAVFLAATRPVLGRDASISSPSDLQGIVEARGTLSGHVERNLRRRNVSDAGELDLRKSLLGQPFRELV